MPASNAEACELVAEAGDLEGDLCPTLSALDPGLGSADPSHPPDPADGAGDGFPFQREMEALFGRSFDELDVSLGDPAAADADANATYDGRTVRFAEASPARETVAHELAHVVQPGGPATSDAIERPDHPAEREAERAARAAASGQPVDVGARRGAGLHREAAPGAAETPASAAESGTIDFGQAPLDPIEIAWDPPPFELGKDELAKAGIDFDIGMRFVPVQDAEGLAPGDIFVDTVLWADVSGRVGVGAGYQAKQKAIVAEGTRIRDKSKVSAGVEASAQASAHAAYKSRRKHSRASYEQVRSALASIEPMIRQAFTLYEKGVELAQDVEKHVELARKGAEDLDEAIQIALATMEKGAAIGGWAAEVALLGQVLGQVLIAAYEVGDGAVDLVSGLMGDPRLARELETGESVQIELGAEMGTNLDASLDADVALNGPKMLNPDGSTDSAKVTASYEQSGEAEWDRIFSVDALDSGGGEGVAISVSFAKRTAGSSSADVGVGVHGVDTAESREARAGHKLEVHLPKDHPRFDELYGKVFGVMSPTELIALTYDPDLRYDGSAGIISLALDRSWIGESSTSTFLNGGDARGLFGGGKTGATESHVTIDYRDRELDDVGVNAEGSSAANLNWADNALSRTIGDELDELLGVNPLAGMPSFEFWKSTNSFRYDGKTASFSGQSGTADTAVTGIRIAMGKTQIEKLAARARDQTSWNAIAGSFVANPGAMVAWEGLGVNLQAASVAQKQVSLPAPAVGVAKTVAELKVLVKGPDGVESEPMVHGQPWIPPEAARDWRVFLMADLIGGFVGVGSALFDADFVTDCFVRSRDMDFTSQGMGETRADYDEVGVEVDSFDFTFSDGQQVTEADLFQYVEDHSVALAHELRDARTIAEAEMNAQLERQEKTHAAMEIAPDEAVMGRARSHLAELRHLLAQARDRDNFSGDNPDAPASVLRFVTDQHTRVSEALSAYQRVFGRHVEASGYAVALDGGSYDYQRQEVVQEDNGSRETDSVAAGEIARSMHALSSQTLPLAIALEFHDDPGSADYADRHKRIADAMKRWHTMNCDFLRIYRRYPETDTGRLRPPADVRMDIWNEAIQHPLRDAIVKLSQVDDTGWAQTAAWEEDVDDAKGHAPVETVAPKPPDAPDAGPELFDTAWPYPAALVADARKKMSEEALRTKHEGLGPADLRAIGGSRADWGFKSGSADTVLEMGARIAHALESGAAPGSTWVIEGHTDGVDTSLFNAYLGYRRAMAVRALLIEAGVPPAVLTVRSFGEEELPKTLDVDSDFDTQRRRVLIDDEDGDGQEDVNDAVQALYGVGAHASSLALTREEDDPERAKFREGQRSDEARNGLAEEAADVFRHETHAWIVREHYGKKSHLVPIFTVIYALTDDEAQAEAILAKRDRFGVKKFQAACRAANVSERLPHNEQAVNDAASKRITFQPGILERLDRTTTTLQADIWKVGGLEWSWYAGAERELDQAIRERLGQIGGPSMELVQGELSGLVKPDDWSLEGGVLTMKFVAASPAAEKILDHLTSGIRAYAVAEPGDGTVGHLGVPADGPSAGDDVQRALRSAPMQWRIYGIGRVELVTSPPTLPGVPQETVELAWQRHVDRHLEALAFDLRIGAEGVAQRLHLGPLVEWTPSTASGTFNTEAARGEWLKAQGRPDRYDPTHPTRFNLALDEVPLVTSEVPPG